MSPVNEATPSTGGVENKAGEPSAVASDSSASEVNEAEQAPQAEADINEAATSSDEVGTDKGDDSKAGTMAADMAETENAADVDKVKANETEQHPAESSVPEDPAAPESAEPDSAPASVDETTPAEKPPADEITETVEEPAAEAPADASEDKEPVAIVDNPVVEEHAAAEEAATQEQSLSEDTVAAAEPAAAEEPVLFEEPAADEATAGEPTAAESAGAEDLDVPSDPVALEENVTVEESSVPEQPAAAEDLTVTEEPAAAEGPAAAEEPAATGVSTHAEEPCSAEEPAAAEGLVVHEEVAAAEVPAGSSPVADETAAVQAEKDVGPTEATPTEGPTEGTSPEQDGTTESVPLEASSEKQCASDVTEAMETAEQAVEQSTNYAAADAIGQGPGSTPADALLQPATEGTDVAQFDDSETPKADADSQDACLEVLSINEGCVDGDSPTSSPIAAVHGSNDSQVTKDDPASNTGQPYGRERVRKYLEDSVVPALRKGMRELVRTKPEDPFQFLADYLITNKPAIGGH